MAVDIVIVNWNSGRQLSECLASIKQYGGERVGCVAIVDNGSEIVLWTALNGSRLQVRVIRNDRNRAFGAACNADALCASSYILFLNPDTRLYEDSISTALAASANAGMKRLG